MPELPAALRAEDVDTVALLAEIRAWVEIETHTPDAAAVSALAAKVSERAQASGFSTETLPGQGGRGDMLIVRHGHATAERKGILILAHLDTVHAQGSIAGPLKWREDGDRVWGPGIYDMKAGACMALEALRLARDTGNGPPLPVTIMYVPDEETGSESARTRIEAEAARAAVALVVEPARDGGKIVVARKSVALFDITVTGRAAHAGTHPQNGRSAIREAAKIVLALEALNDPARGITVTVGTIAGGTGRNTIPAECLLQVDLRLPDAEAAREVLEAVNGLAPSDPEITITIAGGMNRPAFTQTEAGRAIFAAAKDIAADLGIDLVGMATGGGSDGNFTAALGVPTLDGLGADGAGAHTFDEHIFVSSLAPRTALLANLLLTLE